MLLPNKIVPFKESILPRLSIVLSTLKEKDLSVKMLYEAVKDNVDDVGDFLEILDSLYALGRISLDEERGLLIYANRD
jgi:archaellum component FlaC